MLLVPSLPPPLFRILPVTGFSSAPVSHTPNARPCCFAQYPLRKPSPMSLPRDRRPDATGLRLLAFTPSPSAFAPVFTALRRGKALRRDKPRRGLGRAARNIFQRSAGVSPAAVSPDMRCEIFRMLAGLAMCCGWDSRAPGQRPVAAPPRLGEGPNVRSHWPTMKISWDVMLLVLPGLNALARRIVGPVNCTGFS
jgi:hypothetical protein